MYPPKYYIYKYNIAWLRKKRIGKSVEFLPMEHSRNKKNHHSLGRPE